jgi:hypothetical protein
VPSPEFSPSALRAWAAHCEAQAENPDRARDRNLLLRMRDAFLAIANLNDAAKADVTERPFEADGSRLASSAIPCRRLTERELAGRWAQKCRDLSSECMQLAEEALSAEIRLTSLNMARRWLTLALSFELASLPPRQAGSPEG